MCNIKCFLLIFMCAKGISANINETTDWYSPRIYVFWPNATIPFFINPNHFDSYQSLSIMRTLSMFAFKTCLKFAPSLVPPNENTHVMVFENPKGIRKCLIDTDGHPRNEPHRIILGYDCLKSPQIDMIIMKALGFPFEHNRPIRDEYLEVLFENIEPSAVELFAKDSRNILEADKRVGYTGDLNALPYDIDSVMHFGERDYSKNGHRTIMFKGSTQHRTSLTTLDLKKIELVYGPECRTRDRQEQIELCQNYPGVARRKREVVEDTNLRVNRDITPPPKSSSIKELGIDAEVEETIQKLFKVSAKALSNARTKYCERTNEKVPEENSKAELSDVIVSITEFAKNMVGKAVRNLTDFCQASDTMEIYQRSHLNRCPFYAGQPCPPTYRSTKSGAVRYSTQHRPYIVQSTKHYGGNVFLHKYANFRATNDSSSDKKTDLEGSVDEVKSVRSETGNVDKNVDTARKSDVGDHTDVYHNPETGIEIDVVHDRKRRDTDVRKEDEVVVKNSGELDTKVKELEKDNDAILEGKPSRRITVTPSNKNSKWARRRFHPARSSRVQLWDDSNVSIEKITTKRKARERLGMEKTDDEREEQRERHKKKSPQRVPQSNSGEDKEERSDFGSVPRVVELSKRNQEFYQDRKWPDGVVLYMIKEDPNYDTNDVRNRLEEVNAILKKKTCAKLKEIKESDVTNDLDYLVIDTSADYVTGRVGGKQTFGCLELFRGEQHRQHAAMMVMAMLGFYFEVARHDRDKYIRVHLRHVRPDKLHHFEKIRSDATLPLPYDYDSATHPAWQFWRKLGKTGISTVATYKSKDPDGTIMKNLGQHSKLLSDTDLIKINSVYGTECFRAARARQIHKKKFIKNRERYF